VCHARPRPPCRSPAPGPSRRIAAPLPSVLVATTSREAGIMFEPPEFDPNSKERLVAITFDQASIRRGNSNIEHEREVAVFDILEGNRFSLDGRQGGPYRPNLSIVEGRLAVAVPQ